MTQPFLYMRRSSSTHSQNAVFREIDMQLIQIGTDFGADENTTNYGVAYNRVIHWQNDLYAAGQYGIWKYDVANSGDWGVFHTYGDVHTGAVERANVLGLVPASINGSGVLVGGYIPLAGGGQIDRKIIVIDGDGNVTERAQFTAVAQVAVFSQGTYYQPIAYRNSILFAESRGNSYPNGPKIVEYNLETFAGSVLVGGPTSRFVVGGNQLCIAKDNVYVCGFSVSAPPVLWKKVGSSFVEQATIGTQTHTNDLQHATAGSALCEIGGKLYCINPGSTAGGAHVNGWQAFEITLDDDGNYVSQQNITSGILPASMIASNTNEAHASFRIDNITNGGTNPIYELVVYPNDTEGASAELYRWSNAPVGQLVLVNGGLDNGRLDVINTNDGTGAGRIWSGSGTINTSIPNMSIDGANINAEFTLYGASQTGVALELWFDKNGESCNTRGTIISSTLGTVANNRVEGLTATNGTKLTVEWTASADGITSGDNPKVAARVYRP